MRKTIVIAVVLAVLISFTQTESSAASFFQGKTVRILVGASPGGAFDLWARVVARHIGRHIPDNPLVMVENVPGAGHLIMTNQFAKATKPDGLTIAHINGGLILAQMLGQPGYDFDPQKFIYIGAANKENDLFFFSKKSGITSVDKWQNSPTPVKLGGLVPGNSIDNMIRLAKEVLGFPTQIITGYKGTADTLIATDSGELAGGPSSWDTLKANRKKALESGDMIVALQCVAKPLKELPKVPTMIQFAKTDDQKKLIEIVAHSYNDYSRPFAVPAGTPKDRVEMLRKAFQEMIKDKEFLAEVEKMNFTLDPTSAEDLTRAVANITKVDSHMRAKLKEILFK